MNINFWTFLQQCAAMAVWIFLVAGLYAIVERLLETYFPGFLDIEAAGASQAPMTMPGAMPGTDPTKPV